MHYSTFARVKLIPATNTRGPRVSVSLYTPLGSLRSHIVYGLDYSKNFSEQVQDILTELGVDATNPRVATLSRVEEVWILD